jgi:hypothetical protein
MASATLQRRRRDPPLATGQVALVVALLGFAAFGWAVTDARMRGMDAGPGTGLGALGFYTTSWVVMMAAMRSP